MKFCRSLRPMGSSRLFMSLIIVGIIASVLIVPQASAQQEKMGIGEQVTIKVIRGGAQNTSAITQSTQGIWGAGSYINYNTSYRTIVADSSNALTVQTDKHLYKPSDWVKITGTIWSGLIATVGGIDTVSIQIRDANDTVIYSGKSHLNSDGSYSADFQLPSDLRKGWFTLETKADVSQDVLHTLTLKLQAGLDAITKFVVINPTPFPIKVGGVDFEVYIESNSDISNVNFDAQSKKISFTVTGENGTEGVTDITIPKSLLSGSFTVVMDGQPISQNDVVETDVQDSTTLEINYHHSGHEIEVVGTSAIPEFPASLMILAIAISSFLIFTLSTNRVRKIN